ncbi:MAG: hypothetical protein ACQXXH_06935 [Candidatus Bathyarchaeia archaeon]|jgi:hypothetical protein|nr:hypothetical protein [Candidatus Bathyarchaeota archaeon A05DMB-4]MDH7595766.1 hypothetical protein [Candidatus Bathyarchaeota archaeon]
MQNENELPREIYSEMEMQNLIVFSIYSVIKNGEVCTFERLVAECFLKFPKIFGFKRYAQWPDSLKFDRPLRTLREKGIIVGSARDHFELSKFGMQIAKEIESILLGKKQVTAAKKAKPSGRSVDDKLIEYLKNSVPFKKYMKNQSNFAISQSEFRSLLRCTLETPERVLKQNLEYYKNIARTYNEKDLLQFLSACEKQFVSRREDNGQRNTNKL